MRSEKTYQKAHVSDLRHAGSNELEDYYLVTGGKSKNIFH